MTETVRACVQDTFYALIATYLTTGSRDVLTNYKPTNGNGRVVLVDNVEFKIVRKLVGEKHEIPGVNIVYYDEEAQPLRTNPRGLRKLIVVHVYCQLTNNAIADDRTLMRLQRKIDEALVPAGIQIVDFYGSTAVALPRNYLFWSFMSSNESWTELTNLDLEQYLHRSRNIVAYYDDAVV